MPDCRQRPAINARIAGQGRVLPRRLLLSLVEPRLNTGGELLHRERPAMIGVNGAAAQALLEVVGQRAALGSVPGDFVIARRRENHQIIVGGVELRAAGLRETADVHRQRALRARGLRQEFCAHGGTRGEIARARRLRHAARVAGIEHDDGLVGFARSEASACWRTRHS